MGCRDGTGWALWAELGWMLCFGGWPWNNVGFGAARTRIQVFQQGLGPAILGCL